MGDTRWSDIESMFQNFNDTLDAMIYEPRGAGVQQTSV